MSLTLGLPKGSLQDATVQLFARAGFNVYVSSRSYYPTIDDDGIQCLLIRAQEMARYVADGILDAGLTGQDWIAEHAASREARPAGGRDPGRRSRVRQAEFRPRPLGAGRARGLAFRTPPISKDARSPPSSCRRPRRTSRASNVRVNVEFSWGATEVKPPVLADAIVEVTETGSSLRANRLRIIDTVMKSNTQLIANRAALADPWKREKIENLALLLRAAIEAHGRVGLMLNVDARGSRGRARAPAGAAAADGLAAQRRRLGGRQHHHRRAHRAGADSAAQSRKRAGHRRVPAQQDRAVMRIISSTDTARDRASGRTRLARWIRPWCARRRASFAMSGAAAMPRWRRGRGDSMATMPGRGNSTCLGGISRADGMTPRATCGRDPSGASATCVVSRSSSVRGRSRSTCSQACASSSACSRSRASAATSPAAAIRCHRRSLMTVIPAQSWPESTTSSSRARGRTRRCCAPRSKPAPRACSESAARRRSPRWRTARGRLRASTRSSGREMRGSPRQRRSSQRDCAIDFHAGPSEIVVWSDDGRADWIAADLLAQAEHDPAARAILVTTKRALAREVAAAVAAQMPRAGPARQALRRHGAIIVARVARCGDRGSSIASRRNIWSAIARPMPHGSTRRARSSSAAGARRRAATTRRDRITCCPPAARRRFRGGLSTADFVRAFTVQTVTRARPPRNRRSGDRARSSRRPHRARRLNRDSSMTYSAPIRPCRGLRLHLNENTGGCSPAVLAALRSIAPTDTAFYPDYAPVTSAAERYFGVPPAGCSSRMVSTRVCTWRHRRRPAAVANAAAIIVEPAFEMYAACADAAGLREIHIAPDADFTFPLQRFWMRPLRTCVSSTSPIRTTPRASRFPPGDRSPGGGATRRAGACRRSLRRVQRANDDWSAARAAPQCHRRPDVCEGARPGGAASGRAHRTSGRAGAAAAPAAAVQPEHLRCARARRRAWRSRVSRRVRRAGGCVEAT